MIRVLVLILSLCLSLNAAHAAVVGVCDALEHVPQSMAGHGQHPGHHDHAEDHAVPDDPDASPDQGSGKTGPVADHCHGHATFAPFAAVGPKIPALTGPQVLAAPPTASPPSASPSRLERPPRATLA